HDRRTGRRADWRVAEGAAPHVFDLEVEGPDGPRHVPQVQLAEVHDAHAGQAADLLGDGAGHHDAAWLRIGLQTRRHVDPVSVDPALVMDDVSQIDSDSEPIWETSSMTRAGSTETGNVAA